MTCPALVEARERLAEFDPVRQPDRAAMHALGVADGALRAHGWHLRRFVTFDLVDDVLGAALRFHAGDGWQVTR